MTMATFKNVSSVPQILSLPSAVRHWDDKTTVEPGEIIAAEAEADIAYCRGLTIDRPLRGGGKVKVRLAVLVELDAPAVPAEKKPCRKFLNITPRPQTICFPSMQTFSWRERRVIDTNHSIELSDQRDIDLILKLKDLFSEVPADAPTRDFRRSRISI